MISLIIILLIAMGFAFLIIKDQINWFDQTTADKQIILFYGQECPHCQRLEQWIKTNKADEKIKIERKEVYHNQNNAELLTQKAKTCGLNTNSIGVPFLTEGNRCYVGEDEVTNFLKRKMEIK